MAETHAKAAHDDKSEAHAKHTAEDKKYESFHCAVDCVCGAVEKLTKAGVGGQQAGQIALELYAKTHG